MGKLTIKVDVYQNQTVSRYEMGKNDKIEFSNEHATDDLVVQPKGYALDPTIPIPFCDNNNTKVPVITVQESSSKIYKICNDFTSDRFAYEAKIGNAGTEDPIVIIESAYLSIPDRDPIVIIERDIGRDMFSGENFFWAIGGVLFGVLLSFFVESRLRPPRTPPRA